MPASLLLQGKGERWLFHQLTPWTRLQESLKHRLLAAPCMHSQLLPPPPPSPLWSRRGCTIVLLGWVGRLKPPCPDFLEVLQWATVITSP